MDEAALERELAGIVPGVLGQTGDNDEVNEDVEFLRSAFVNEKLAPELLPHETELVENIQAQLENQQGIIDDLAGDCTEKDANDAFAQSIYQMEVDRIKYTLASYLRTRLRKIEKHTLFLLQSAQSYNRLSDPEFAFAKHYLNLLSDHMTNSALDSLPENLRSLVEQTPQCNMIETPDLDQFVFCRALRDVGEVQMDDSGELSASLAEGDIMAVRYAAVRGLVLDRDVQLL